MKKVCLILIGLFLISVSNAGAVVYYWTGATDLAWSTASNWSPARSVPTLTDTLIFSADSTVHDTVVGGPTETVAFVKVVSGTAIWLQTASGKRILSLNDSLVVESGASLSVISPSSAADTLVIYLNANARGTVDGLISLNYYGTTTGPRHRLDAADSLALQFNAGSTLIQNTIGNVFGTTGGSNRVAFNAGSQFIQYYGSNPFGLNAPASKVVFRPGSWYRFRQNSSPSFSGRTYSNFELDFPAFSQTATGGNPLSMDTLQITDGRLTLSLQRINIKGDIAIAASETLQFRQAGVAGAACSLKFNGTTPQTIGSTGTLLFLNDSTSVYVDNAAGLTINRVFPVGYNLNLINGVVTANDTLKMRSDQVIQRTNGYVIGNLALHVATTGSLTRIFPLGTANGYSPSVVVFSTVTTPGYLTCRATQSTHPDAAIPSKSLQRYWSFTNDGVTFDSYQMGIYYNPVDFNTDFTESADESSMLVGKNDSGAWTFPSILYRDTSLNYIEIFGNTFSDFTLGKDQNALAPDTIAPYIVSTTPADGDSNVALNAPIVIVYSEPMDISSINGYINPSNSLSMFWSANAETLTLVPDSAYSYNTTYTIYNTDGTDLAGNPIVGLPVSFSFTTIVGDTVKPTITGTSPANGATEVALNTTIFVAFSEPVDTLSLIGSINPLPTISYPTWNATMDTMFYVHSDLKNNTTYTLTITGLNDLSGNPLAVLPDSFTFTTIVGDTVKPYIVSTSPADGDSNVALNAPLVVVYSEPMDTLSFVGFSNPPHQMSIDWSATMDTVTFTPDTLYDFATTYIFTETAGTDLAGNDLVGLPFSVSFTTIPSGVEGKPGIISVQRFYLAPVAPNPVRTTVQFRYGLTQAANVTLEIFNVTGQKIKTLVKAPQSAGDHSVSWNGRDEVGMKVSSGVYVCRLQAGGQINTKRFIMVR